MNLIYTKDPVTGATTIQWGNIASIALLVVVTIYIVRKTPLKGTV